MKLTKKDFFDGEEMTEREREIYAEGQKDSERFAWFVIGLGAGAFIVFIAYIIDKLKH